MRKRFSNVEWRQTTKYLPAKSDYYDPRHQARFNTGRVKDNLGFVSTFELRQAVEDYAQWLRETTTYFANQWEPYLVGLNLFPLRQIFLGTMGISKSTYGFRYAISRQ